MTFHSCVQSNFFWYRILIDTIPICVHTRTHTFVNWQHVTITVAAMKDSCTRCSASKNIWTRPATWLHSVHENTVPITHSVSLVLLSLSAADDGSYWLKHVLQQWVTIGRKLVVYHFCGGGTRGKKMSDVVIMVLLELQFTLHLRPIWLTGWPPVVLGSGWLAVKVRWVKTAFCFCVVVAAHEHCW